MYQTTVTSISDPLTSYWNSFVDYVPQLIAAMVVLLVGLIAASVVAGIVGKLLSWAESNSDVQKFLKRWDVKLELSGFVSKFIWWAVFLVFVSATVEILQVNVLTQALNLVIGYLPAVFAAAVIAVVVLVGARVVRELVRSALDGVGFAQSRGVSTAVYVALVIFGFTMAVAQLGIDTTLITANLTVVLGGVMLALALAFGLGGREVASKVLNNLYEATSSSATKKRK